MQRELNQGEEPRSLRYSLEEKETIRRKTQWTRQKIVERVEEDKRTEEEERGQKPQGNEKDRIVMSVYITAVNWHKIEKSVMLECIIIIIIIIFVCL